MSMTPVATLSPGQRAAQVAYNWLGTPYKWGGTDTGGVDCSGLVQQVYAQMGISVPRTTFEQVNSGSPVASLAEAQPGDLIFLHPEVGGPGHVGIYVGNGQIIDANHTGGSVGVRSLQGYGGIVAIRRLVGGQNYAGLAPSPASTPENPTVHGLGVIADMLSVGQSPTLPSTTPVLPSTTPPPSQAPNPQAPTKPVAGGQSGDMLSQLEAGFRAAGRDDLAQMVRTPAFNKWIGKESSWDSTQVSPANNQGMPNGGLFQFWYGHDWAKQYFQGDKFTASPYEQAYLAATHFNLTPQNIEHYAAQIDAKTYEGWG